MKKKTVWVVFYTTESGADYAVKSGLKTHQDACDWELSNREKYQRPLIIRKITY